MTPESPSEQAPGDLTHFQSPSAASSYFPESHWQSEISSLSKVILVLGKARSHRATNLGCMGAESPGWFDVLPKNSARDVMHEQACCRDEAVSHQVPRAVAFGIIQIVSSEQFLSFMQNLTELLLYLLSHFECDSHTVHMLTQWHLPPPLTSTVRLSLFTHTHCSLLSLAARLQRCCTNHSHYVNNGWIFSRQNSYVVYICENLISL